MRVRIEKGRACGVVEAPPSKSMAHRLLICAGLAGGRSVIHGIAASEDVLATLDCLAALGVRCEVEKDTVTVYGNKFHKSEDASAFESDCHFGSDCCLLSGGQSGSDGCSASGSGGTAPNDALEKYTDTVEKRILSCRESGSTLRFFLPICLAIGGKSVFKGKGRLPERPQDVYRKICEEQGISFSQDSGGITVEGYLKPARFTLPGNVSSQFVSGLLFALPLLSGDSKIEIIPPVESRPYIEMTIAALESFGVTASWEDENTLFVKGRQSYEPQETAVEGDYSNAAFLDALGVLGGDVKVSNLRPDSLQGDKVYGRLFDLIKSEGKKKVQSGVQKRIDISDCPDLGPVLFAVAAACGGGHFTGCRRLKIKESDRAAAMAAELAKLGVPVEVGEDEVVVGACTLHAPQVPIDGHNDHRIVMAMAVLLTLTGGEIEGAEAVNKSFPDFFEKLKKLGIEVRKFEN